LFENKLRTPALYRGNALCRKHAIQDLFTSSAVLRNAMYAFLLYDVELSTAPSKVVYPGACCCIARCEEVFASESLTVHVQSARRATVRSATASTMAISWTVCVSTPQPFWCALSASQPVM
jgi:hypothetical protein